MGDRDRVQDLAGALTESPHEIVRGMSAWALGHLGGSKSREVLETRRNQEKGLVRQEIEQALEILR